ncbi:MAG: hypothetical protein GY829_15330 [Gammaproteobacteria bacterium]|nr:hypothetical protein [Gammaproteobacteria bacterium]
MIANKQERLNLTYMKYPKDFSEFKVGETYPTLKAKNSATNSSAALSLISQARRTITLFTHNFDHRILDTPEIASAISDFIKVSPNSQLKTLLCDPSLVVKQGHRIVELSRKFSSFISIRQTHAEYLSTPFSFLIIDDTALLFRPHANEYNAIVNYDSRLECRHYLEFFNEVWQQSEPVSEIRQLFI